ncbi:unnamed protein product [Allacma fusca]|uniref:diphosphoinositol-polyphosphate diphosphatase n=1 Tax=Allacma fusca TaxID=39272 RepID=A0A8J2PNN8_9HEXA|nr:unnamed protein product [Allacma fusca]
MVKEKPNSTRIYDQDGYRQRAACICVKNESETEVLMVSSSRNSDQWIFPGGGLEPDETSTMAAIREVTEEAGVRGKLGRCLGTFENQERKHRTAVYVMIVTEELAEWDDARNIGRKRKWFNLEEAVEQLAVHKPSHLNYLNNFRANSKMNHETDNGAETS